MRVLANLLRIQGVDYVSSDEVLQAVKGVCGEELVAAGVGATGAGAPVTPVTAVTAHAAFTERTPVMAHAALAVDARASSATWVDIPPYQGDVLVRGSEALSKTKDGRAARLGI